MKYEVFFVSCVRESSETRQKPRKTILCFMRLKTLFRRTLVAKLSFTRVVPCCKSEISFHRAQDTKFQFFNSGKPVKAYTVKVSFDQKFNSVLSERL